MVLKTCVTCGNEFEAVRSTAKYCSTKCCDNAIKDRTCVQCGVVFKGTRHTDYCDNCRDIHKREKTIQTSLERYGETNAMKNKEVRQKVINTMIERYGVENAMQSDEVKETMRNNNMEKYGVEYAQQTDWVKKKMSDTFMDKYGVARPQQCDEIKEKRIQTCIERWGVDNTTKVKEVREKMKATLMDKYGVEYPFQSKELRDRAIETNKERYGTERPTQLESVQEKIRKTNIEKFGVPYYVMTEEYKENSKKNSDTNKLVQKMFKDNGIEIDAIDFPLVRYEYDIKVGNTLIEINPYPYHNSTRNPYNKKISDKYHMSKTKTAKAHGYRCIHVFDWDSIEKVISLLKPKQTIYARNCEIKQIQYSDAHELFETYHLQGDTAKNKNNIYIGLYYNGMLVECMSFGKPRYNKHYEWEILRLCSHGDYTVVGGASRIFKHFIKNIGANNVISYCDMSKFDGSVYEQLGFKLESWNNPSKHRRYTGSKIVGCPMHITARLLMDKSFDKLLGKYFGKYGKGTNNEELMRQNGYVEIYDAGQARYVRHK